MTTTPAERRLLSSWISVDDARRGARRRLPRQLSDYIDGGADDEVTLHRNRSDFRRINIRQRSAVWTREPDTSTSIFGQKITFPVLTAPCGGTRLVHPEGDLGIARAAIAAGTIPIISSASGFRLEEVADSSDGPKWFQLYRFGSRAIMEDLVHRAGHAGYDALVATVDTAVPGNRERDRRNGFSYSSMRVDLRNAVRLAPELLKHPTWGYRYWRDGMPFDLPNTANESLQSPLPISAMGRTDDPHSPTWADLRWVRSHWHGPLIVKGVLDSEDAREALDIGADGVIVSNHGGRQLDGVPSSISVLPQVADAVGDAMTVILDSGVRRGTDIIKALALGASAVLVGRPSVWGLAVGGGEGVFRVLEILREELLRSLILAGIADVDSINRSVVTVPERLREFDPRPAVTPPHPGYVS